MTRRPRGKNRGHTETRAARATKAAPPAQSSVSREGWTLLAHSLFLDQLERLSAKAATESEGAAGQQPGPATKLLAHVLDLVFEKIPQDPASPAYRHGGSLGGSNRQWFRAKTGNGRFRLFFRFHSVHRIIVYAWLNDEQSLRTYGSSTDAYAVFAGMPADGNPPSEWDALVGAASSSSNRRRLEQAGRRRSSDDTKRSK